MDTASRAGPKKLDRVALFSEKLSRATSAVLTDYRGLTVADLEELRTKLRQSQVDYLVVKNTLARRAATDAGAGEFAPSFTGPVAVALGYDDLSAPARILNDYAKATKKLKVMGAWVEGRVLGASDVTLLAELPSRDDLLAQLAGTLQSPVTQLAGSLNSIMSNFAATLDAYRTQLESAA